MRIKLKKNKFILLSSLLIAGVSITVSALVFHYNNPAKSTDFQKKLKNDRQAANAMPLAFDQDDIILVLVCAGLIGFFGVRRQSKTFEKFVRVKQSESRDHANLSNEEDSEKETHPGKLDISDTCQLGMPCSV